MNEMSKQKSVPHDLILDNVPYLYGSKMIPVNICM